MFWWWCFGIEKIYKTKNIFCILFCWFHHFSYITYQNMILSQNHLIHWYVFWCMTSEQKGLFDHIPILHYASNVLFITLHRLSSSELPRGLLKEIQWYTVNIYYLVTKTKIFTLVIKILQKADTMVNIYYRKSLIICILLKHIQLSTCYKTSMGFATDVDFLLSHFCQSKALTLYWF